MGEWIDELWQSQAMNVSGQNNDLQGLNNMAEYKPYNIKWKKRMAGTVSILFPALTPSSSTCLLSKYFSDE